MHVESYLAAIGRSLIGAGEGYLDSRPLLYALIVVVLIPVAWFVASQAFAAIVGHHALKIYARKDQAERAALEEAKQKLYEQNSRLIAVNALLLGDRERLQRETRRLLKRALKAELTLTGLESEAATAGRLPTARTQKTPPKRGFQTGCGGRI